MKNAKDFVIENGHLKEYIGNDTCVIIPDNVIEIDTVAFKNCENLVSVSIPEGITKINRGAFYNCCNLTTISFPLSIEEIGSPLVFFCPELSTFILPEGIEEFKGSVLEQLWNTVDDKYNKRSLVYSLLKQYPKMVGEVGKLKRRAQSNIQTFVKRALEEDDSDLFCGLIIYAGTLSAEEFEDYLERRKKVSTLEQTMHYYEIYKARYGI